LPLLLLFAVVFRAEAFFAPPVFFAVFFAPVFFDDFEDDFADALADDGFVLFALRPEEAARR
jgi:hypothetical protein